MVQPQILVMRKMKRIEMKYYSTMETGIQREKEQIDITILLSTWNIHKENNEIVGKVARIMKLCFN